MVAGFIGESPGVVGFIRCRRVYLGVLWGSSCTSWDAVFVGVRPGGRRVHPGSIGSLERVVGISGSSGIAGFIVVRLGGSRIHQGSLDSFGCALWVNGFIRVRLVYRGAPWGLSGSSKVAGVRP